MPRMKGLHWRSKVRVSHTTLFLMHAFSHRPCPSQVKANSRSGKLHFDGENPRMKAENLNSSMPILGNEVSVSAINIRNYGIISITALDPSRSPSPAVQSWKANCEHDRSRPPCLRRSVESSGQQSRSSHQTSSNSPTNGLATGSPPHLPLFCRIISPFETSPSDRRLGEHGSTDSTPPCHISIS